MEGRGKREAGSGKGRGRIPAPGLARLPSLLQLHLLIAQSFRSYSTLHADIPAGTTRTYYMFWRADTCFALRVRLPLPLNTRRVHACITSSGSHRPPSHHFLIFPPSSFAEPRAFLPLLTRSFSWQEHSTRTPRRARMPETEILKRVLQGDLFAAAAADVSTLLGTRLASSFVHSYAARGAPRWGEGG